MNQLDSDSKFQCYCGDWKFRNAFSTVHDIQKEVCRDLPYYGSSGGKDYCVLHFPSKNKVVDFEAIYYERIHEENWDFRFVFFPNALYFPEKYELSKSGDFSFATFSDQVDFRQCFFKKRFNFFAAEFTEDANFGFVTFDESINFNGAKFNTQALFYGATFGENTRPSFGHVTFTSASFDSAIFEADVRFEGSQFKESAEFTDTKFQKSVNFSHCEFPSEVTTKFQRTSFGRNADFSYAKFFETDFSSASFGLLIPKYFDKVSFLSCDFNKSISFSDAAFDHQVSFTDSVFRGSAHFERAKFGKKVNFSTVTFHEDVFFNDTLFGRKAERITSGIQVSFDGAEFGDHSRVFFDNTWFSWLTSFDYARFGGHTFFIGSASNKVFDDLLEDKAFWGLLSFANATFDQPDKLHFKTVRLRPNWFVNSVVDIRTINFTDIDWSQGGDDVDTINAELTILRKRINHNTKKLLGICYRQLADNAESNSRFQEASNFRRLAFQTERLIRKAKAEDWFRDEIYCKEFFRKIPDKLRSAPFDLSSYLYWLSSTYGENSGKAFIWLLVILLMSTCIFSLSISQFVDDGNMRSLGFFEAIFYSLRIMVLQKPEPSPANLVAKGAVAVASFLAPLQLALLALAIRRKFMR
mgnify:CR=1 FL=1